MMGREGSAAEKFRRFLARVGLVMMLVSFVWLQLVSKRPEPPPPPPPPSGELFSVVVIDPGHGGQDSGAMVGSVLEKDLTLDLAQRVARLVQNQGLTTVLTRNADQYIPLANRASVANRERSCIFVSIHFNDTKKTEASGVETYFAARQETNAPLLASWLSFLPRAGMRNEESEKLAGFIQEALVGRTQAINRGTKAQQFFVLANVRHPAVLVEGGFLTNKQDVNKLLADNYREQIAAAIAEGIDRYRQALKAAQPNAAATKPQS